MTNTTIRQVDPRSLVHLPTKNPNVMDPQTFEALVKSMRTDGFLQPVLVVEENGQTVIVDGVHRSKAAVECGLPTIPAVVAPDRARAEILRLALNRMRGELDLTEVGHQLQLLLDEGFDADELTLTGFAEWEISAMLDVVNNDGEDDLLTGANTTPVSAPKPKTYSLAFKFESESERARVKEALEQLADSDMRAGLLTALDTAAPGWRD